MREELTFLRPPRPGSSHGPTLPPWHGTTPSSFSVLPTFTPYFSFLQDACDHLTCSVIIWFCTGWFSPLCQVHESKGYCLFRSLLQPHTLTMPGTQEIGYICTHGGAPARPPAVLWVLSTHQHLRNSSHLKTPIVS